MKILVTYKSKTGFTKKYAEWIAEELGCEAKDIKTVSYKDVSDCGLVIHGGWIFGGVISGFNKIKKMNPKNLIMFGVGYTPKDKVDLKQMIVANGVGEIPFFYYEGGTNPEKMGLAGRKMVEIVTKEKVVYKDNTNKADIEELVKMAKNKIKELEG